MLTCCRTSRVRVGAVNEQGTMVSFHTCANSRSTSLGLFVSKRVKYGIATTICSDNLLEINFRNKRRDIETTEVTSEINNSIRMTINQVFDIACKSC